MKSLLRNLNNNMLYPLQKRDILRIDSTCEVRCRGLELGAHVVLFFGCMEGIWVWGLGLGVQYLGHLGFRSQGSGYSIWGIWVQGLGLVSGEFGFRLQGLGCSIQGIQGLGLRAWSIAFGLGISPSNARAHWSRHNIGSSLNQGLLLGLFLYYFGKTKKEP